MARKDPRLSSIPDNFNEQIQDRTIRHMLYLEGLKTRQANEIDRYIVKEIIPDLQEQLAARLSMIEDLGFDRGPATTARIETQIAAIQNISQRFNGDLKAMVQGELFELANDEVKWQVGVLRSESGVNIEMALPAAEQLRTAVFTQPFDGKNFDQWFKSLEDSTRRRIGDEVRRGVVEGRTVGQHIRAIAGTRASGYTDGVIQTSRRQADAIARTTVAHVQNTAHEQLFEANSDIIKGVVWNSALDTATCQVCASLDGKFYKTGERKPALPAHVSCRCSYSPVTKSFRELGIDADDAPAGLRSSMNGSVPRDLSYNAWLKKQSAAVQEEALGPKRAALFRKGDLSVNNFVSRRGQIKTLADIRMLEADAFEKAGL